ncbi:MAG: hypothetical protein LQ343_006569 [Gyalolechia ehrenbergii]|nr:MAG: hypothetical protein LQ343_006569 [Gyalolechia ehrenbergii]
MAPLRLQIVVQPRAVPSPSGSTLPEPTIKWLEICPDYFTIQELCERLEKRFFDRNHAPLNIKILKYLDDLELFPEYRVRDIFEDINKAQSADKSYSTVKVYRNPPTRAELVDPRRFDSLPPNSLARPIKRPLPPLFADATQNVIHDPIDHGHPLRGCSPVQSQSRNKRRKVRAFDFQLNTDSDRPLDSLDDRHEYPLRTAPQRPSAVTQIEDSQKKRRSPEPLKPTSNTEVHEGSDPYGTPISSQTKLHDIDKPLGNEVIYIPDSPSSGADAYTDESLRHSIGHGLRQSRSPEIPTSNAPSSSQEVQSEVPLSIPLPQSNQQHQKQAAKTEKPLGPSPVASKLASPVSQGLAVDPSEQAVMDNALKTPSPKQKENTLQPGRLRRPKPYKQPPRSKHSCKLINGVRQTAPSMYDPIETSEGSTHERELLRSAKRSRTSAPHESPKSKVVPSGSSSTSSGARSVRLHAGQSEAVPPPTPDSSIACAPLKPVQNLETTQVEASSATAPVTAEITAAPTDGPRHVEAGQQQSAGGAKQSEKSSSLSRIPSTLENQMTREQAGGSPVLIKNTEVAVSKPSRRSVSLDQASASIAGDNDRGKSLKRQLEEAEENKRRAQAEFDRIAALQIEQKQIEERRNEDTIGHSEDPFVNPEASKDPASSAQLLLTGSQQPLKAMSVEERRKHNLKHVTPGLNKQLSGMIEKKANELQEEKQRKAAIQKQERAAQLEAHRQARLVRAQKLKDQKIAAEEQARADQVAEQQQPQTQEAKSEQKRSADQTGQEEQHRVDERKTKFKQGQQPNEEVAENAKPPMQKRVAKKTSAQQDGPQETLAEQGAQKVKPVGKGKQILNNESLLEAQSQIKRTGSDKVVAKVNHDGDTIGTEERQTAPQQVVGEHNLDWLVKRSPKAIYNAQRQLQLANKMLKHAKQDSMVIEIPRPASNLTPMPSHNSNPAPPPKAHPPVEKAVKKQRQEVPKADQKRKTTNGSFTDSEALRAAGIYARPPNTTAAPKDALSSVRASSSLKSTNSVLPSSSLPGQPRTLGLLKVLESQSSSPVPEPSIPNRVRTMTPAIPSSSARSNRDSTEAKASITTQAASAAAKTPIRSALRVTSGASGRSVSFAHGSNPSSQSQDVSSKSTTQVPGTKKGMLHRALQESNAKKAEAANERLKSASSGLSARNNVQKPVKQTKLTQHISRDFQPKDKGKGKAIRSPTPRLGERIVISSASEASTYYSDESEEERNARAGPSSRKRLAPILKSAKANDAASDNSEAAFPTNKAVSDGPTKHSLNRVMMTRTGIQPIGTTSHPQSSVKYGRRSAATPKAPEAKTTPASPGKRTGRGPLQSTTYANSDSDSRSGSASGQADDASLLPSVNPRKKELLASSQQTSQKGTVMHPTSSPAHQRLSSSLAPMSPKDRIEDARIAKLREERRQSEEADRQLQREHNEAVQRQRAARAALAKQDKLKDGAAFDKSALSALRKAQAAAEPVNEQKGKKPANDIHSSPPMEASKSGDSDESSSRSGSDDDVDTTQQSQKAGHAATSSQGARFVQFAKEIFSRK